MNLSGMEVEFQPLGKRETIPDGYSILDAARQSGIDLASACGGEGNCGQCRVILLSGKANAPDQDEVYYFTADQLRNGYRLACRAFPLENVKVQLPKGSLITGQRLQVESSLRSLPPDPRVQAYPVVLEPPSLEDPRSDLTRVLDELQERHGLDGMSAGLELIRTLSPSLRKADWKVSAFIREGEVISINALACRQVGLAVDLGTTKIAAMLVDLETGETLASAGVPNPQIAYGEDVISRLNYAYRHPDGSRFLAELVHQSVNDLLLDLVGQAGCQPGQVADACIVGNTAMIHLLLGLPTQQLATAPYVAAASQPIDLRPGEIGLGIAPGARVHIPPSIGGFVGADHVAMVLASDLDQASQVTLGLDIGTNTEISLRLPDQPYLTAISCASGPAFEGAHIQDGMRAASGAIEKANLNSAGWNWTTIDDEPPIGLCGSGILDVLAWLYRGGILTQNGRLQRDQPGVREGDHGFEFLLVPGRWSGSGRDIVITQHDVNEIQLAKGAIQAGINVLIESAGISPTLVQQVIVAGAFGSFLNIQNAVDIGLFPKLPNASFRQVGNASALGAKWILFSREARQRAVQIARNTRYLELTTYPKFNRRFAQAMLFPERPMD